jgi:tripartite-type tricarboxylate transporter receptor subunit TctC
MLLSRFVVGMPLVGVMILGMASVGGQTYPNKPIRIVTTGFGSGGDFTARLIAQGISGPFRQPVIVENRPNTFIQAGIVIQAPPDGYTLYVGGGTLWITPLLQKAPYDVLRDLSPITLTDVSPNILAVHPSVPAKSVKELIDLAKAKPGELNFSSSQLGGSAHLVGELFKAMTGIHIVNVPHSGTSAAITDVLAGNVQLTFGSITSVAPHIKSGKLRGLAVSSVKPSALVPGLPPIAETVPGFDAVGNTAAFARARTPVAIISRLNQEIVRVLNQADNKEKLFNAGVEVVGSSPEQLAATLKGEIARWSKVIKDAGIKVD